MKRLPAEWEKQSHIQLVFPSKKSDWGYCYDDIINSYIDIISKIQKYQPILIICDNVKDIKKLIKSHKNINFFQAKTNDTWIRDFGAIEIYKNGKIVTLDFGFNGWGLKYPSNYDNLLTRKLYKDKKLKTYNFILEGGSIDTNGDGVILTTSKCLLEKNRNPQFSKKEIEKKLNNFLGTKKVLWLNHGFLEGDDTDSHIDMLARFINKNKICYIKCDDKDDIHYHELKKMQQELKNLKYDLLPLPLPKPIFYKDRRLPASYINFLFLNGAILIPIYNDPYDQYILNLFKKEFPNYDIIGVDCSILIRENGSLHCATKNIFRDFS